MLKCNFLKKKLENGDPVLGTWSVIPSTITTDIIASCGLDFIIIDTEHGPISFEKAQEMAIACDSHSVSPVMRVGAINESDILRALDIGVHCIQIPNVNSKRDVEQIINYAKYPPEGERGFSPFTRAGNYSINSSKVLTEYANQNTLIAINIEGEQAIQDIDNILELKSLDIIFIGLFDLSKALGIPGDVQNPKVIRHLEFLTKKINEKGKYAGTITTDMSSIDLYLNLGIKYLVHLVDCELIRNSYANVKQMFDGYISKQ